MEHDRECDRLTGTHACICDVYNAAEITDPLARKLYQMICAHFGGPERVDAELAYQALASQLSGFLLNVEINRKRAMIDGLQIALRRAHNIPPEA